MWRGGYVMPTNKRIGSIALAALMALVLHVEAVEPATVWVFTADPLPPLQHTERADRLFVLDAVDNALKKLSFANPGNEAQATQRALALIQSQDGQAMTARLRLSAEAIAVAWQHGIAQLPAVLVDERYVVYGVYDVQVALAQIAGYRDAQ